MDRIAQPVGTSKFYMLRCLVAVAHADGIVCDAEIAYISGILNRLDLTEEQENTIEGDFQTAQKIEDLLPYINEPKFRGQVVDFARILAYKDGELHPNEERILEKLHAAAMDGVDMDALRAQVKESVAKEMLAHDISIDDNRPTKHGHAIPWLQMLDEFLLANGIDLMKD